MLNYQRVSPMFRGPKLGTSHLAMVFRPLAVPATASRGFRTEKMVPTAAWAAKRGKTVGENGGKITGKMVPPCDVCWFYPLGLRITGFFNGISRLNPFITTGWGPPSYVCWFMNHNKTPIVQLVREISTIKQQAFRHSQFHNPSQRVLKIGGVPLWTVGFRIFSRIPRSHPTRWFPHLDQLQLSLLSLLRQLLAAPHAAPRFSGKSEDGLQHQISLWYIYIYIVIIYYIVYI